MLEFRQSIFPTAGFVFCGFFFFGNWLYTQPIGSTGAFRCSLLVSTGDSDFMKHDLYAIFSSLGVLNCDTSIAAMLKRLGWDGILFCIGGLALKDKPKKVARALIVGGRVSNPTAPNPQ